MDFSLSAEQLSLVDTLDRAFADTAPLHRVQAFAEGEPSLLADLQVLAGELGLAGLLRPEAEGGAGLGLLDAALLAEAIGRRLAPLPYRAGVVLLPLALRAAVGPGADGDGVSAAAGLLVSAVLRPLNRSGAPEGGVRVQEGCVRGEALLVEEAQAARLFLVEDAMGALHLVEAAPGAVTIRPARTLDRTRRFFDVAFEDAPARLLTADPAAATRLRAVDGLLLAAETLGAAQEMLARAVAYAGVREQFDRPIAAFQAVKHMCAEMACEIEPARSLVWYAAAALDAGLAEGLLAAAHAKGHLAEIGRFIARTATEVHGGIGFTDALGLHLWFKRIEANRQLGGSPEGRRREAARLMGL